MYYDEKVAEAKSYIEKNTSVRPRVGVILGSGLGNTIRNNGLPGAVFRGEIRYEDIPYWPHSTAPGHAGVLLFAEIHGVPAVVMQGRVHYYEGYTMEEVTFPTRVLGEMGVKTLIVTNASGAVNENILPGTIAVIKDHINMMGTNPLIGVNNDKWGVRFPDMTYAYDREYIESVKIAAKKEGIELAEGVYFAMSGPSYETPAEIRMARLLGADLIGMSTVPEVIVANHMGIDVLCLSCAANAAAGITENRLSSDEVIETMNKVAEKLAKIIFRFIKESKL
ncbi:MAG: purine-nucleoside phosphorylase [Synergistes sp.]|nr:purine-nucleoside phosphorylase [Synergistes sp.]